MREIRLLRGRLPRKRGGLTGMNNLHQKHSKPKDLKDFKIFESRKAKVSYRIAKVSYRKAKAINISGNSPFGTPALMKNAERYEW
jgi:hypothetical protein